MKTNSNKILCLAISLAMLALPWAAHSFSVAAMDSIDLNGKHFASDSFDSSDPNYSTNGRYDSLKRKAGGDIVAKHTITNSGLNVGNVHIAGHVITGHGSISIGPNGSVGDLLWIDNNFGIQPGWALNNMDVSPFAEVVLPSTAWVPTGSPGLGTGGAGAVGVEGVLQTFDHVFTSPLISDYAVFDNGTIYVGTNISVRLKFTVGNFNPNAIYVAGTGNEAGKMTAYLTGTSATLGTEHMTQSGKAENLVYYGLPSVTNLAYKGNGDIAVVIYAPQADFQLASGGSGTIDFIGSTVTKTVQLYGKYYFHFDEDLRRVFPFENPIFISRPQNQTVVAGQDATFNVSATSSLPLTYQWNFRVGGGSDVPISGATNSTLTVTNVTAQNEGYYSVVVSNAAMSATSSSALLTVLSPVPVLSQPSTPSFGQFQFNVTGIADSNYVVLASTNCVDWSPLVTNAVPFTFVETNATGFPARFYRAVFVP